MDKLEIRKEVLDYFRKIGEDLKNDLNEEELAYAKIMEDPILDDKVREIERNSPNALKYYQEMENYYDKYVNPETRNNLTIDDRLDNLTKDFFELVGGARVGFAIKIKKNKK